MCMYTALCIKHTLVEYIQTQVHAQTHKHNYVSSHRSNISYLKCLKPEVSRFEILECFGFGNICMEFTY